MCPFRPRRKETIENNVKVILENLEWLLLLEKDGDILENICCDILLNDLSKEVESYKQVFVLYSENISECK